MAAQHAGNDASSDQFDDLDGFGVAVVLDDGKWKCTALGETALTSLEVAERELLEMRASGAVFGLLDVDEEFFVILRPAPTGTRLLLSDATMALDYDIAADVLEALNVETPELDVDDLDDLEPWAEGDLGLLADLGLPEPVLGVILADTDLYPDEQLAMVARRLGFGSELSAVVDAAAR